MLKWLIKIALIYELEKTNEILNDFNDFLFKKKLKYNFFEEVIKETCKFVIYNIF